MLKCRATIAILAAAALLVAACDDPKPAMSGRMRGPADLAAVKACPQREPGCNRTTEGHHLLLVTNSRGDDVRLFDTERRTFFEAFIPLFPLSIPVGRHPRAIAVDPHGEWAFVGNLLDGDVSLIDLAPNRLVEVDCDGDPGTAAASLDCPAVPDQAEDPINDRCLAGVSRAVLGQGLAEPVQPEDIAVPRGSAGADAPAWPQDEPLPVWVSLPGAGRLVLLHFIYPLDGGPQLLRHVAEMEVGGLPSGLAVSDDGTRLYAADEASDSIVVVDTAAWTSQRVVVGGPTRRVYLGPREEVLYAVRLDDNRIALVDTATLQRRSAFVDERPEAQDPNGGEQDMVLPGIPRAIGFSHGHTMTISTGRSDADPDTVTTYYPFADEDGDGINDAEPISRFGFVSDMDGNVYVIDAERHGNIDILPLTGPSVGSWGYVVGGDTLVLEDFQEACQGYTSGDGAKVETCPHPHLAGMDRYYTPPDDSGRQDEPEPVYNGIWVRAGATKTEGWILTWEGVLPGTGSSASGRFAGLRLEDDRPGLDFEISGVQRGDRLQVLSPPAPDPDGGLGPHPACVPAGQTEARTELRVAAVSERVLQLEDPGMDPGLCWPGAVRYQVRARNAWTVLGTVSGPQPRAEMWPWDEPPPEQPAYDNGLIAFTLIEPAPEEPGVEGAEPRSVPRDAAWGFSTDDGFENARFAPSVRVGQAGPVQVIDLDDGADEEEREEDDPLTGPADDRVYVLFEGSNALMELFPDNLASTNYLLYQ